MNYVKIGFGDKDVTEILAKHINSVRTEGMAGKIKVELVEKGKTRCLKTR